ncbi:MAG: 50S ribosomal protein L19e [archaeon]
MDLKTQKRIAAQVMKVGETRVWLDPNRLEEIKEAITKADVRSLVKDKAIQARPERGISRFRIRKHNTQKRKGRRKGQGSRQGSRRARLPRKLEWINKIRSQRAMLIKMRDDGIITRLTYRTVRRKAKGGYFRSRRHLQLYLEGANLLLKKEESKTIPKEKPVEDVNTIQKKTRRKNGLQ